MEPSLKRKRRDSVMQYTVTGSARWSTRRASFLRGWLFCEALVLGENGRHVDWQQGNVGEIEDSSEPACLPCMYLQAGLAEQGSMAGQCSRGLFVPSLPTLSRIRKSQSFLFQLRSIVPSHPFILAAQSTPSIACKPLSQTDSPIYITPQTTECGLSDQGLSGCVRLGRAAYCWMG